MHPAILTIILLIILIGAGATYALLQSEHKKEKQKLIQRIQGQKTTSQEGGKSRNALLEDPNKRRAEIAKKLKDTQTEDHSQKKKVTISMLLAQAGLSISPQQFFIFSAISMAVLALLAKAMGQPIFVVVMAAVVGFFGVPKLILKRMAAKRQKKFLEEFPDALEATIRLLKAGMPVSEAVLMISREFTGPVGEEMSRIYDQQKIGVALHEAALAATKRMPLSEMKMFATGLAIQAQTGSSLSEVLQNLSSVMRARYRLKRKIKALSSEAIASASIIGALPNLLASGMYFTNKDYIEILFTDSFGQILLAGAVVWMGLGIVVMKIMINFKI